VEEKLLSKESMKKETQSRMREEVTENTEEDQQSMKVKIEKMVLVEEEEKERKVVKETTERRIKVKLTLKVPKLLKLLLQSKKKRSQKLKLNTKLSDNLSKISTLKELPISDKLDKPDNLRVSKELKLLLKMLIRQKKFKVLIETPTLTITLLLDKVLILWDLEPSETTMMMSQLVEVEEAEEAEVVEEEEVVPIDQKVVKEELTQNKPSRKPKKISQLCEREDLVDLPSKELAE